LQFDGKDIKEERKIFEEEKLLNGFGNEYIVVWYDLFLHVYYV